MNIATNMQVHLDACTKYFFYLPSSLKLLKEISWQSPLPEKWKKEKKRAIFMCKNSNNLKQSNTPFIQPKHGQKTFCTKGFYQTVCRRWKNKGLFKYSKCKLPNNKVNKMQGSQMSLLANYPTINPHALCKFLKNQTEMPSHMKFPRKIVEIENYLQL